MLKVQKMSLIKPTDFLKRNFCFEIERVRANFKSMVSFPSSNIEGDNKKNILSLNGRCAQMVER
jgi:hypothetical protein